MPEYKYEIDKLRNDPSTRITLTLPTKDIIVGFMKQETFAINGSANYQSAFNRSLADTLIGGLGGRVGQIKELAEIASQRKATSLIETILSYGGGEPPSFSLELLFIAIRDDEDVRVPALKLLEGTYPIMGLQDKSGNMSKGWIGTVTENVIMSAPWGYDYKSKGGRMGVKIGNWFQATEQVLRDVSFNFSKEVIEGGLPLYAEGSITFSPARMIEANELKKYFIGMEKRRYPGVSVKG